MTCSSRGLAQLGLLLKRFGVDGLDEDLDNRGTTDLRGELFSTTNRNEKPVTRENLSTFYLVIKVWFDYNPPLLEHHIYVHNFVF